MRPQNPSNIQTAEVTAVLHHIVVHLILSFHRKHVCAVLVFTSLCYWTAIKFDVWINRRTFVSLGRSKIYSWRVRRLNRALGCLRLALFRDKNTKVYSLITLLKVILERIQKRSSASFPSNSLYKYLPKFNSRKETRDYYVHSYSSSFIFRSFVFQNRANRTRP